MRYTWFSYYPYSSRVRMFGWDNLASADARTWLETFKGKARSTHCLGDISRVTTGWVMME